MNQHEYNRDGTVLYVTIQTHNTSIQFTSHSTTGESMTTSHATVGTRGHVAARPNHLSHMTELDVTLPMAIPVP